jgi:hypothetical protein
LAEVAALPPERRDPALELDAIGVKDRAVRSGVRSTAVDGLERATRMLRRSAAREESNR